MCCMKTNPKVARCPSQQARLPWWERTGLQGLHSLHGVSCVPEKQATNSSTTSKAWGAAPLPAKKPHTCPVLLHLLVRPVQLLQTSQPLLMFWTCWIHVIDKVFLKTSWLKEKNNFGCLGFAQLALLAPVAVLQERFKVISTQCNCEACCLPASPSHMRRWSKQQSHRSVGNSSAHPSPPQAQLAQNILSNTKWDTSYTTSQPQEQLAAAAKDFFGVRGVLTAHVKCF